MTFRRVTLPSIRSGILSGAFVCFMASFDNIPVSLFLRDAATECCRFGCGKISRAGGM
jgi:putative spermidine/putrescine transport system permease protein